MAGYPPYWHLPGSVYLNHAPRRLANVPPFDFQLEVGRSSHTEAQGLFANPHQRYRDIRHRLLQTVSLQHGSLHGTRRFELWHVRQRHQPLPQNLPDDQVAVPYTGTIADFLALPRELRDAIYEETIDACTIDARRGEPGTLHAEAMEYQSGGGGGLTPLDLGNNQVFQEAAQRFYRMRSVVIPITSNGFQFIPYCNTPWSLSGYSIGRFRVTMEDYIYAWLTEVPLRYSPTFNPFIYFTGKFDGSSQVGPVITHQVPDFGELRYLQVELDTGGPPSHYQIELIIDRLETFLRVIRRCRNIRRLIISFAHHAHWLAQAPFFSPQRVWTPYRKRHEHLTLIGDINTRAASFFNGTWGRPVASDFESVLHPFVYGIRPGYFRPENILRFEVQVPQDLAHISEFVDFARYAENMVRLNYRLPQHR